MEYPFFVFTNSAIKRLTVVLMFITQICRIQSQQSSGQDMQKQTFSPDLTIFSKCTFSSLVQPKLDHSNSQKSSKNGQNVINLNDIWCLFTLFSVWIYCLILSHTEKSPVYNLIQPRCMNIYLPSLFLNRIWWLLVATLSLITGSGVFHAAMVICGFNLILHCT